MDTQKVTNDTQAKGKTATAYILWRLFLDYFLLGLELALGSGLALSLPSLAFGHLGKRELLRDYEDCAETMHTIELDCLISVGVMDGLITHDMDSTLVMRTNERFF